MLFYERVRHLGDKILRVPCVGYTDSLWLWTLLTCGVGMGWADCTQVWTHQVHELRRKEQMRKVDVNAIDMSGGRAYKKSAVVTVAQATHGQKLITTLKNGTVETSRILSGDECIITNPSGEQYAVSKENLIAKYDKNPDGTYSAKGQITAVKNPFGRDITIIAPWGEEQHGDASCYIAQSSTDENDRYIIGHNEFIETYKPV